MRQDVKEIERVYFFYVLARINVDSPSHSEVFFGTIGPGYDEQEVGKSSEIGCFIYAPELDESLDMYINGISFSKISPTNSPWQTADFERVSLGETLEDGGSVNATYIIASVQEFTEAHNETIINCTSEKYKEHASMKIILRPGTRRI